MTIDGATVPRSGADGLGSQAPSDASIPQYALVSPGQLVVNPMWLVGGSIGVAKLSGAVSPAYRVYKLAETIDPRFLHHVVRSEQDRAAYRMLARGETTFDRAVSADDFESLPIAWPSLEEQGRIADFLDDRVARIDQIITARRQQLDLVRESAASEAARLLDGLGKSGPPLSAVAGIVDTEHKTAPSVPGGGHWIAGTGAIRNGCLLVEQLRETDGESFREWTFRGAPRPGDVLLTREAPVGEVALLTSQDLRVAIGQRVVLLQPRRQSLSSAFLRLVLMAGDLRQVIDRASAGSLHPHLNMADISRLRIPSMCIDEQSRLGAHHQRLLDSVRQRSNQVDRSVALLQEYKQSLITAAVTGELDVTTAGSGIPG